MNVFLPDKGSHNIYHFLIYMIPELFYIDFIPEKIYINCKKYSDILSILYPNTIIIDSESCPADCQILNQTIEPISRESGVLPEYYIYLRNLFSPIIRNYKPKNTYSEYIYISRNDDSEKRKIVNEDDYLPFTRFQKITMSGLCLLEQMYIFHHAKEIISPHGAALTNILFCNKDVSIIEIASKKMSNLMHFQHIADTLGLQYSRYTDIIEIDADNYDSNMMLIDGEVFR